MLIVRVGISSPPRGGRWRVQGAEEVLLLTRILCRDRSVTNLISATQVQCSERQQLLTLGHFVRPVDLMETVVLAGNVNLPNPCVTPSFSTPGCGTVSMAMTSSFRGSPLLRSCVMKPLCNGRNRMVQVNASDSAAKRVVPSYANYAVPIENQTSSFITRPLAEILRDMNKRVPDKVLKIKMDEGVPLKYIPWFHANRMLSFYAPGWSGEVRNITFSSDGKTVSVVYRVTIRGLDGEAWRESSGTATLDDVHFGDPVQKAEGMAFRRACARFGLGLYLYHEDETP